MFPFPSRKPVFRYPVGAAPRTAVLAPWFRAKDAVRVFPEGWCEDAARFAPAAIAGTRPQLLGLAAAGAPELTHAVIVLSQPGEPPLTPAERQQLWRAFRVPVFTQLVEASGRLLAAECEAHDGLHLTAAAGGSSPEYTAPEYTVETTPCACGLATPRLTVSQPAKPERAAAVVAR